jgi:homoserine dehydrogenase
VQTPPDLDVDGIDTAHKLSLVAAVSNGCLPDFPSVYTEGIRKIGDYDVAKARARPPARAAPVERRRCILGRS